MHEAVPCVQQRSTEHLKENQPHNHPRLKQRGASFGVQSATRNATACLSPVSPCRRIGQVLGLTLMSLFITELLQSGEKCSVETAQR